MSQRDARGSLVFKSGHHDASVSFRNKKDCVTECKIEVTYRATTTIIQNTSQKATDAALIRKSMVRLEIKKQNARTRTITADTQDKHIRTQHMQRTQAYNTHKHTIGEPILAAHHT